MATIKESSYQITKITRIIPKPFDDVITKLHSSLKQAAPAPGFNILDHVDSKESFEAATNAALGPHDLMLFQEFKHGEWMSLYGVHGKQVARIIFGNPQIAVTMLRHDVGAGLFVPVEALIIEQGDKSTAVIQIKPSSIIAGEEGASAELKKTAEALDAKLQKLWEFVAE